MQNLQHPPRQIKLSRRFNRAVETCDGEFLAPKFQKLMPLLRTLFRKNYYHLIEAGFNRFFPRGALPGLDPVAAISPSPRAQLMMIPAPNPVKENPPPAERWRLGAPDSGEERPPRESAAGEESRGATRLACRPPPEP